MTDKPPRKSRSKALVSVPDPVTGPVTDDDGPTEELLANVERWRRAWELHMGRVSYRKIGEDLGVSGKTAFYYVRRYEEIRGVSPKVEQERQHQLTMLGELEQRLWHEAATDPTTSWVAVANQILGILDRRRRIVGLPDGIPEQVSDGETATAVPGAVRALAAVKALETYAG
jgi:hypothetical protein